MIQTSTYRDGGVRASHGAPSPGFTKQRHMRPGLEGTVYQTQWYRYSLHHRQVACRESSKGKLGIVCL